MYLYRFKYMYSQDKHTLRGKLNNIILFILELFLLAEDLCTLRRQKVECIINFVCSPVNPAVSLKIRYFKKFNANAVDLILNEYIFQ